MITFIESKTKYTTVVQVVIPDDPFPGTMGNLILLKEYYGCDALRKKKNKKKEHWQRYAWNIRYLRERLKQDGILICAYCGKHPLKTIAAQVHKSKKDLLTMATVDHIIAVSQGGDPFDKNNVCVACNPCNQRKGSQSLTEFISSSGKVPVF